jgi:bifunctional non-homologous end joining protein LigD
VAPSRALRFVVQKHAARRLHYDLRLELDGTFKSWAVTKGPSLDPKVRRLAVEVEDHPLAYGDFEGTIPKGEYGGGTVQLWDRGYWSGGSTSAAREALRKGSLHFALAGERMRGEWILVRMAADRERRGRAARSAKKRNNWLLIKRSDREARPGDGDALLAHERSVASGRTMDAIAAGRKPDPEPFMSKRPSAEPSRAVWSRERRASRAPHATPPCRASFRRSSASPASARPRDRAGCTRSSSTATGFS